MEKPTSQNGTGSRIHIHHTCSSYEDTHARSTLRAYYYRHIRHSRHAFLNLIASSTQTLTREARGLTLQALKEELLINKE